MTKNKRPAARKSGKAPEDLADALAQKLCDLAAELVEKDEYDVIPDRLREHEKDFHKAIKKCLLQKRDEVLYDALERARFADDDAYRLLRAQIEETAEVVILHRDDGAAIEVNAFTIPLFVRSRGGLRVEQGFQDQEAFAALTKSIKAERLESAGATVVLVAHAYHLDEIDRITFSQINEMTRDAAAAMMGKKASTAAIEKSMSGWPASGFGPDDEALELRFIVGFALKPADDPFYRVPADEAQADAYFTVRANHFQRWTERCTDLVARCLTDDGRALQINFEYQDLFHGGKQRGMAEQDVLQMLSELSQGLDASGLPAADVDAVMGPVDVDGAMLLCVQLLAHEDQRLLATAHKPVADGGDIDAEFSDAADALGSIGVGSIFLARGFDASGAARDVQAFAG